MNQYFLVMKLNEVRHCIHVWRQTDEMWLYVQVRSLEAKNRQLELNIAEFCQQKSTVVTKNYGGYYSTISDLRAEVPLTLYITQHTERMIKKNKKSSKPFYNAHTKPRTFPNIRSKHLCRRLKHLSIVLLSQKLLTPINVEVWIRRVRTRCTL